MAAGSRQLGRGMVVVAVVVAVVVGAVVGSRGRGERGGGGGNGEEEGGKEEGDWKRAGKEAEVVRNEASKGTATDKKENDETSWRERYVHMLQAG